MSQRAFVTAILLAGVLTVAGCAPAADAGRVPEAPAGTTTSPSAAGQSEPDDTSSAATEGAYLDYTDGVIEATPGQKALFFHAPWCPQCRALDEDLRAEGAPAGLTVFKVDYDSRTDLRQKYGVTLQTTIVFVDDAGEAVSSQVLYDEPTVESLVAAIP